MQTSTHYITLSLILCCSLITAACSSKDTVEHEEKLRTEKSITDNVKEVDIVDKTSGTTADATMQALENIKIDVSDSDTFLVMNADKEGVTTTASGLQYLVLTQGDGPKPTTDSVVQVHYRGTFPNGEEFDSSYKRGEPATFGVTRVIKGWTEALLLMNEGSKYELVIPSELAYGTRGAGSQIPPNQVLKFEVELLNANYN